MPPDWDRSAGDNAGMPMPPNKRAGEPAAPRKKGPRNLVYVMRFALPEPSKLVSITTYDPDDFIRIEVDKASVPAGCKLAKHPSYKAEFVRGYPVFADIGDMPASVKSAVLRSPFLWVGVLLLLALIGALVFSDGVAELARFSADYQRRIQHSLSTSLRDIQSGSGSLALWTLAIVCFGYGVVHTLGPGHGKAVVVAYFLDSTRPRAWIEGVFAGSWIAFTHTLAALLLAAALKAFASVGLFGALREVRNVEIVSYTLILLDRLLAPVGGAHRTPARACPWRSRS